MEITAEVQELARTAYVAGEGPDTDLGLPLKQRINGVIDARGVHRSRYAKQCIIGIAAARHCASLRSARLTADFAVAAARRAVNTYAPHALGVDARAASELRSCNVSADTLGQIAEQLEALAARLRHGAFGTWEWASKAAADTVDAAKAVVRSAAQAVAANNPESCHLAAWGAEEKAYACALWSALADAEVAEVRALQEIPDDDDEVAS